MRLLSGLVGTSGGLAGLVLPLPKCLVTRIPTLIVRACDGLSWDTPAWFKLSRAMPTVMGRWEFVNIRL